MHASYKCEYVLSLEVVLGSAPGPDDRRFENVPIRAVEGDEVPYRPEGIRPRVKYSVAHYVLHGVPILRSDL